MGRSSRDNGFAGSNGIWLARKIDSIVARDPRETFYGSAFIAEFIPAGYWISRPRVSGLKPACANTENTWKEGEVGGGAQWPGSPRVATWIFFLFFRHPPQSIGFFNRPCSSSPFRESNELDTSFEKKRPFYFMYFIIYFFSFTSEIVSIMYKKKKMYPFDSSLLNFKLELRETVVLLFYYVQIYCIIPSSHFFSFTNGIVE